MAKSFMCTNCYWSGTTEEMDHDGSGFICPRCCAPFEPDRPEDGPWEAVFEEGDPNHDDNDWEGFELGTPKYEGTD